jgi:bacillithiol biosynthesis deacetylase BshB1
MKLLVFGIHPDDAELGCGGTIARLAARGHEVVLVDLSKGESSSNGTPEEREREAEEAARILGCKLRDNLGLPDTALVSEDADQQRAVASAVRRHRPDVVFLPSKDDPHPDHSAGGELVERAIYLAGIHGYQTGKGDERWRVENGLVYPGRREVESIVVFDISDTFEIKMNAIRAHKSQFGAGVVETPLNHPGFLASIEARAIAAGHSIGVRYGEPFRTVRPITLRDLTIFE